jgi:hypothetical protein
MQQIDRQRYLEIVPLKMAVEDDLLGLPGVTGVDVGYKEVGGEQTDEMAIIVFVGRKGEFDEGDRIPSEIHGVKTDVVEATFRPLVAHATPAHGPGGPEIDAKRTTPSSAAARPRRPGSTTGTGLSACPSWTGRAPGRGC